MNKVIQDVHEPLLRRFLYERGFDNCNIEYIFINDVVFIEAWYEFKHQALSYTINVSQVLQIDPQFRSDYLRYHALSFAKYIEKEIKKTSH